MDVIDNYHEETEQNMEKLLTNLNANLATMAQQMEGLNNSHQKFSFTFKEQQKLMIEGLNKSYEDFCRNFNQQQMLQNEEIAKIRVEVTKIRKKIK